MRVVFIALCLVCFGTFISASARTDDKPADKSGCSTGRQQTPETIDQKRPQGWTGSLETVGVARATAVLPRRISSNFLTDTEAVECTLGWRQNRYL